MQISSLYQSTNREVIWDLIVQHINDNGSFNSVKGIRYKANITGDGIFYIGGNGQRGATGEKISRIEFLNTYDNLNRLDVINTNTIKEILPNTMYRKRTPFIGILYSTGILEK